MIFTQIYMCILLISRTLNFELLIKDLYSEINKMFSEYRWEVLCIVLNTNNLCLLQDKTDSMNKYDSVIKTSKINTVARFKSQKARNLLRSQI
jgi:hypothetical protein